MASLQPTTAGYRVQFRVDGKSRQISLPGTKRKAAESVTRHVEELIACRRSGERIHDHTVKWLSAIGQKLRCDLQKCGLIDGTTQAAAGGTMLQISTEFLRHRPIAAATLTAYEQTFGKLHGYFLMRPLDAITEAHAEDWRHYLLAAVKLSENTVRKHCSRASTFWNWAVRRQYTDRNPFHSLPKSVGDARGVKQFISAADIESIIDQTADPEWRLLIALGRWGGLRVPSEPFAIRWEHISWDNDRFTVESPKTGARVVPIFRQLLPHFLQLREHSAPDSVWLFERLRQGSGNVRDPLLKLIRRAGVKPWPRLWNSMRSTRETELVRDHQLHVACDWLGNSPVVAMRHYLQTTEEDMRRAVQSADILPTHLAEGKRD